MTKDNLHANFIKENRKVIRMGELAKYIAELANAAGAKALHSDVFTPDRIRELAREIYDIAKE